MRREIGSGQRGALGAVTLLLIGGLAWAASAASQGQFSSTVNINLAAPRAGLGLAPGSDVSLHGVRIGTVESVDSRPGGGATIALRVEADRAAEIPANATATIQASTFFGPQSVSIEVPASPADSGLRPGSTLEVTSVGDEFNDVFEDANALLVSIDPGRLNASLSTIASVLDGRGARLGETISGLQATSATLRKALPAIRRDIELGADVSGDYARLSPLIAKVLDQVTSIGRTLLEQRRSLEPVLLAVAGLADETRVVLDRTGPPLITAMRALRPAAAILREFSSVMPCTLTALDHGRELAEATVGNVLAGIQARASILPAQSTYRMPRDKTKLVHGFGPDCLGLPTPDRLPAPRYLFPDGTQYVWNGADDSIEVDPNLSLGDLLFGPGSVGDQGADE